MEVTESKASQLLHEYAQIPLPDDIEQLTSEQEEEISSNYFDQLRKLSEKTLPIFQALATNPRSQNDLKIIVDRIVYLKKIISEEMFSFLYNEMLITFCESLRCLDKQKQIPILDTFPQHKNELALSLAHLCMYLDDINLEKYGEHIKKMLLRLWPVPCFREKTTPLLIQFLEHLYSCSKQTQSNFDEFIRTLNDIHPIESKYLPKLFISFIAKSHRFEQFRINWAHMISKVNLTTLSLIKRKKFLKITLSNKLSIIPLLSNDVAIHKRFHDFVRDTYVNLDFDDSEDRFLISKVIRRISKATKLLNATNASCVDGKLQCLIRKTEILCAEDAAIIVTNYRIVQLSLYSKMIFSMINTGFKEKQDFLNSPTTSIKFPDFQKELVQKVLDLFSEHKESLDEESFTCLFEIRRFADYTENEYLLDSYLRTLKIRTKPKTDRISEEIIQLNHIISIADKEDVLELRDICLTYMQELLDKHIGDEMVNVEYILEMADLLKKTPNKDAQALIMKHIFLQLENIRTTIIDYFLHPGLLTNLNLGRFYNQWLEKLPYLIEHENILSFFLKIIIFLPQTIEESDAFEYQHLQFAYWLGRHQKNPPQVIHQAFSKFFVLLSQEWNNYSSDSKHTFKEHIKRIFHHIPKTIKEEVAGDEDFVIMHPAVIYQVSLNLHGMESGNLKTISYDAFNLHPFQLQLDLTSLNDSVHSSFISVFDDAPIQSMKLKKTQTPIYRRLFAAFGEKQIISC